MKRLTPFSYFEPLQLDEAIQFLAEHEDGVYPLAGGTDLLVRMKRGDLKASCLVNLKRIPGLDEITRESGQGMHIGPLTSISALETSASVRLHYPVLARAAGLLGTPSIRNLGTLGGNVGRASPAADLVPALIVLKALVSIAGPDGNRRAEIEKVFAGPGKTTLGRGELITDFFVPEPSPETGAAYLKLGRREGVDCALVGAAVLLVLSGDREVKEARIALSAVGPTPIRARKAEEALVSGPLTSGRIWKAAQVASGETFPISDVRCSGAYRKEMVAVLTRRALEQALHLMRGENTKK